MPLYPVLDAMIDTSSWRILEKNWLQYHYVIGTVKMTRLLQNSSIARTKRRNKRDKICLRLNISRKQQWEILKFW